MMPLTQSDGLEEKGILKSPINISLEMLGRIIEKKGFSRDPISFSRRNGDETP
jgi:hypothetical protein